MRWATLSAADRNDKEGLVMRKQEESAREPLRAMAAYIDLNPVRANLVSRSTRSAKAVSVFVVSVSWLCLDDCPRLEAFCSATAAVLDEVWLHGWMGGEFMSLWLIPPQKCWNEVRAAASSRHVRLV